MWGIEGQRGALQKDGRVATMTVTQATQAILKEILGYFQWGVVSL